MDFQKSINTYEKRRFLLFACFSICVLFIAIDYFQLGQFLNHFTTLVDFYSLLASDIADKVFFVRAIRFFMDQRFTVQTILRFFMLVVGSREYFMIFCSILLFTAVSHDIAIKRMKQWVAGYWITYFLQFFISAYFILVSRESINTDAVVANMNIIGTVFTVISCVHIALVLLSFLLVYRGFSRSE